MNTTATFRVAAVVTVLLASGAAYAGNTATAFGAGSAVAEPCGKAIELRGLDARIVGKASQGVDARRQFIWITRGIYALDMADTVAWLDQQRAARTTCVADASPVASR